jgi:hypothetical protein
MNAVTAALTLLTIPCTTAVVGGRVRLWARLHAPRQFPNMNFFPHGFLPSTHWMN